MTSPRRRRSSPTSSTTSSSTSSSPPTWRAAGCHLVSEGGLQMIGEIVTDGMVVVGDAAGLTLYTGLTVRGMDLAAGSAVAAAAANRTTIDAKDVSRAGL